MSGTIIVAGGMSRRMGWPKAALLLDEVPLLRRAVSASRNRGAFVVVVGPPELSALLDGEPVLLTREDPPGGGPSAGIAAGLAALPCGIEQVQLLPCDLPHADRLVSLLDEVGWPTEADALVPVDAQGWPQYLAGRYRTEALRRAVPGVAEARDVAVRRLLGGLSRTEVAVPSELLVDVDDPASARSAGVRRPDGGPIA